MLENIKVEKTTEIEKVKKMEKNIKILKIQNDESTKSDKIKKTEKNIEMHEGNHDIKKF